MNEEKNESMEDQVKDQTENMSQNAVDSTESGSESGINTETSAQGNEVDALKKEVEELKDKYLRLYSEFDNFRRRSSKEKSEIIKTASEDVLVILLPILDDFERAKASMEKSSDAKAIAEGVNLIQHKLIKSLEQKGLKAMDDIIGKPFDSELHEAVTQAPAPSEDLKGKVIDVLEKGYFLNEKVIRYAKVIIGA
ncbi:MAG: nucleotide exchange factor GrpE [Cytophagaceae bacterium]